VRDFPTPTFTAQSVACSSPAFVATFFPHPPSGARLTDFPHPEIGKGAHGSVYRIDGTGLCVKFTEGVLEWQAHFVDQVVPRFFGLLPFLAMAPIELPSGKTVRAVRDQNDYFRPPGRFSHLGSFP
jgi:hypothetical protein